jgi:hypothetical protein
MSAARPFFLFLNPGPGTGAGGMPYPTRSKDSEVRTHHDDKVLSLKRSANDRNSQAESSIIIHWGEKLSTKTFKHILGVQKIQAGVALEVKFALLATMESFCIKEIARSPHAWKPSCCWSSTSTHQCVTSSLPLPNSALILPSSLRSN